MSHAAMREHIKAKIEHADPATLQSIWEIFAQSERRSNAAREPVVGSTPSRNNTESRKQPLSFVGENWTLEEFERLSPEARATRKWELKKKNYLWLQEKFSTLDAAWVAVVDGKIIAYDQRLKTKPASPQLLQMYRRTGKFPFVFVNEKLIAIEEGTAWHETVKTDDFYPALPLIFSSASGNVDAIGDFDTGSSHTFIDYDFLAAQNVIRSEAIEDFEKHLHLNKTFIYVDKLVVAKSLQISATGQCLPSVSEALSVSLPVAFYFPPFYFPARLDF